MSIYDSQFSSNKDLLSYSESKLQALNQFLWKCTECIFRRYKGKIKKSVPDVDGYNITAETAELEIFYEVLLKEYTKINMEKVFKQSLERVSKSCYSGFCGGNFTCQAWETGSVDEKYFDQTMCICMKVWTLQMIMIWTNWKELEPCKQIFFRVNWKIILVTMYPK